MRTGQEVPETSVVRSHGCGRERTKRKFEVWGERLKKSFTVDMAKLCQIWTYFPGEEKSCGMSYRRRLEVKKN